MERRTRELSAETLNSAVASALRILGHFGDPERELRELHLWHMEWSYARKFLLETVRYNLTVKAIEKALSTEGWMYARCLAERFTALLYKDGLDPYEAVFATLGRMSVKTAAETGVAVFNALRTVTIEVEDLEKNLPE